MVGKVLEIIDEMSLNGKTVLVVGGAGFIGTRLIEKLIVECNAKVRVLVRNIARAVRVSRYPIEIYVGDASDEKTATEAAINCDVIFDCSYPANGTPSERIKVSKDVAASLLAAGKNTSVSRLVHISSVAVYGYPDITTLDEKVSYENTSDIYTKCKLVAEQIFLDNSDGGKVPVVVLQPTVVYGPFSGWSYGIISQLKSGQVALLNGGGGVCNAVYVDDLVDAIVQSATKGGIEGEKFLISAANSITWKEFYSMFETIMNSKSTVDMTKDEIEQAIRRRSDANRPVNKFKRTFKNDAQLRQLIINLPIISQIVRVTKSVSSDNAWMKIRGSIIDANENTANCPVKPKQELMLPNVDQLPLLGSKTSVCINKARKCLQYDPKFELDEGMRRTASWARWANII